MNVEDNQILGFGEIWSSKLLNAYLDSLGEVQKLMDKSHGFFGHSQSGDGRKRELVKIQRSFQSIAFKASLVKSLWGVSLHQMRMAIQQI